MQGRNRRVFFLRPTPAVLVHQAPAWQPRATCMQALQLQIRNLEQKIDFQHREIKNGRPYFARARPGMRAVASPEQPADRGPAQPSSEPSPETPSAAVGPAVPAGMPAAWPAHTPQTPVQQPAGLAALGESQPGSLPAHTTNLPPPSAPAALSASTIAPGASNIHPSTNAATTTRAPLSPFHRHQPHQPTSTPIHRPR